MVVRWWLGVSGLATALLVAPAQAAMPVPRAVCVTAARAAVSPARPAGPRRGRGPGGRRNRVTGGRVLGRHPTRFAPGITRAALRARVTRRRVAWRLGARVAR